jgi:hypothetical protein
MAIDIVLVEFFDSGCSIIAKTVNLFITSGTRGDYTKELELIELTLEPTLLTYSRAIAQHKTM